MKILLVDDDTAITQVISRKLKQDNYVVEIALSGEYAIDLLYANPYSLVVLDILLPQTSGLEVCQTLRRQGDKTPILMLTSQDRPQDKVMGLDAGADDYLVKPFNLDELSARVRALLRRNSEQSTPVLGYGLLEFDPMNQAVTYQTEPVSLRPKELAILELLMRYPTQIFEPDALLEKLWNLADCPGKATIKTHIRTLRKQLAAAGAHDVIETLYGRGYRLNPAFLTQARPVEIPTNQDIITQTWQQVQSLSWQKLMQLQQRIESLKTSSSGWVESCTAAAAIAHQLKGTLGMFGMQTAALQAKHIEKSLTTLSLEELLEMDFVPKQVDTLVSLVRPHITESSAFNNVTKTHAQRTILVVCHNTDWGKQLQQISQDSVCDIAVCSPVTMNTYLLASTPQAFLIELSAEALAIDLSLIDALHRNYGSQRPIVIAIASEDQRQHLPPHITAVVHKDWSAKTVVAIVSEYTNEY